MEPRRHTVSAKKEKYPRSKHHFFLTANHKHYILFLNEDSGFLLKVEPYQTVLLNEFKMKPVKPLQFLSTGKGDIHILHSKGILWQYLERLTQEDPFCSIQFTEDIKPLKFVCIDSGSYLVICQGNKIVSFEGQKIAKTSHYPAEMLMHQLQVDNERKEVFQANVIVPSRTRRFPYIFSCRQLVEWQNDNYLEGVIQICSKFYLQDEQLSEGYKFIFFSSQFNRVYLVMHQEIVILSIRRASVEGLDFLATVRMKVRLAQPEDPFSVSINRITGALMLFGPKHIKELDPVNYATGRLSLKQKDQKGQVICYGYVLDTFNTFVFLVNDYSLTKLRLVII